MNVSIATRRPMKPKPIKIFNGRGQRRRHGWGGGDCEHVFIGAHSKDDAVQLMNEAGFIFSLSELNVYFAKGCWGNTMEGITPERGVWVIWGPSFDAKPERII